MEELEVEGEGSSRYLELRKGGIDEILDDMMDDAVESVGDNIEEVSEYFSLVSQLGERGIGTAFSLGCIETLLLLYLYRLLGTM